MAETPRIYKSMVYYDSLIYIKKSYVHNIIGRDIKNTFFSNIFIVSYIQNPSCICLTLDLNKKNIIKT